MPSDFKAADDLTGKVRRTLGDSPYYPDEGDYEMNDGTLEQYDHPHGDPDGMIREGKNNKKKDEQEPYHEQVVTSDDEWWPTPEEYEPGLTAGQYKAFFENENIVKRSWLDALYQLYLMPDHQGTCTQLAAKYGYAPAHYISYLSSIATHLIQETDGQPPIAQDQNVRYWPVLFQGKHTKDKSQGTFCWRLREPVIKAVESLEEEGFFKKENVLKEGQQKTMPQFDHNMILYGPPGTGKTYNSVIYAVAICEGKAFEEIEAEPYPAIFKRYRELAQNGRIAFTTFHQSYGYEEFIEGIKPNLHAESGSISYSVEDGIFKKFCKKAGTEPVVFIIDEINRGNISKIFGELITLIEDTKREGASEAMEAVLPYSGEIFSVPQNVYILGTMNTADRSIALIDTALRRRFSFIEMMPKPEVLDNLGIGTIEIDGVKLHVSRMLAVINRRIEYLFDREHTIGHAFFIGLTEDPSIETLARIFEKRIIPLLQEYFYEDYGKIQLVLGDNAKENPYKFILDQPIKVKDIFKGNPDIDLPEKSYTINYPAFRNIQSYKQIGDDL